MDILELIDLEHPNSQQETRPFPCNWEGCTKVSLMYAHTNCRHSAVDLIWPGISAFIQTKDPSPVRSKDAINPSSNGVRSLSICACIPESDLTSVNGWVAGNPSAMYFYKFFVI